MALNITIRPTTIHRFPSDLGKTHPYIKFKIIDANPVEEINFHMPIGISFADGAGYGTMNLGAIGSAVLGGGGVGDFANAAGSAISSAMNNFKNSAGGNWGSAIAASVLANMVPGASFSSATEVFSFAQKSVMNSYTNVTFTGTTPRAYSFTFKLMAVNLAESKAITNIVNTFRRNMYPRELNAFLLKYPSKFEISFFDGANEMSHVSKIYETYMTSMNVTYNATSNVFFETEDGDEDGGAPSEVDVAISFQETRSLSQKDIDNLEKYKIRSYGAKRS